MTRVRALVVAARPSDELGAPPAADLVVAADGGLEAARSARWAVHAVVGDMDSASAASLEWARSNGAAIEVHPARKDSTDLELALEFACRRASDVHVIASGQGRLDHTVANLLVLASPRWADVNMSAAIDGARIDVVRGRRRLPGQIGDTLSLLAVGGPARIASSGGLEYPLTDEWLSPASARGVSNVIVGVPATLDVVEGVLLAINSEIDRN